MGSACSGGQSVATDGNAAPGAASNKTDPPPAAPAAKEQPPPPPPPAEPANENVARNGDIPATSNEPSPVQPMVNNEEKQLISAADDDADAELKNIDGGPAQYKLVYFAGLRFRAEQIRLILRYANVPYEEQLVSFAEWNNMKENTPMACLPLLYIDDRVICQTNAIGRFLAKKYGLAGKTNWEAAKVDMFIDAMTDVMNELSPLISEQDSGKKSDLWHQLKDDVILPFLDRCIKLLAENSTGWFVCEQATWADLAIAELLANLTEKVDITLLNTYPALQAHINGVRSLPHIAEYIAERPDAMF